MAGDDPAARKRVLSSVVALWNQFFVEIHRAIASMDNTVDLLNESPAPLAVDGRSAETVTVRMTKPLILDNLPERRSGDLKSKTPKRLHVELSGWLEFDLAKATHLVGYGTHVVWAYDNRTREQNFEFADGYHFDMDDRALTGHPVFHAQRDCTVTELRYRKEGTEQVCVIDARQRLGIKTIRIPTAQMDLFSACIMLIADHLVNPADARACKAFKDMLARLAKLWPHDMEKTPPLRSRVDADDFRSRHWYFA